MCNNLVYIRFLYVENWRRYRLKRKKMIMVKRVYFSISQHWNTTWFECKMICQNESYRDLSHTKWMEILWGFSWTFQIWDSNFVRMWKSNFTKTNFLCALNYTMLSYSKVDSFKLNYLPQSKQLYQIWRVQPIPH